ncbi:hypothetical protein ACWGB8_32460 [Kitasatospora sp. NPDC054939]
MTDYPAGPATRTLRAALFAALVVLLAGLGQVLVTGRPLPLATLALAGTAVFAAALLLAGGQHGFGRVAAVFVPLELGLSALFGLAQTACPSLPPDAAHGLRPLLCGGGSLGGFLLGHGLPSALGAVLLVVLHTVIGLAAAFWLHRADAALGAVLRATGALRAFARRLGPAAVRRLLALLGAAAPARPVVRAPFPRASRVRIPADPVVLGPAVRRGPPVLAAG